MSARARKPPTQPPDRPSDDAPTTIYDSGELPARKRPAPVTAKGSAPPERPTVVDKPRPPAVQAISKREPSAPIQAISMKTPGNAKPPEPANPPTPILPRPKLRAVSEVTPAQQQNFGTIAQPYNPKEARARAVREYVIWGCIAVILASAIALVVWFTAR